MTRGTNDFSNVSMLDLFKIEVDSQVRVLSEGLMALEQDTGSPVHLESLMRASHSIKGAARMVDVEPIVKISHEMEDCFVAAQKNTVLLDSQFIDVLLSGVDLISKIILDDDGRTFSEKALAYHDQISEFVSTLRSLLSGGNSQPDAAMLTKQGEPAKSFENVTQLDKAHVNEIRNMHSDDSPIESMQNSKQKPREPEVATKDRVIRVSADRMDRLLGLAGEATVESRWMRPYLETMLRHKRYQYDLVGELDKLRNLLGEYKVGGHIEYILANLQHKASEHREYFSDRLIDLEQYDYRSSNLSNRLHREVIASRMRPFSDGTDGLQRMVRDLARSLGKEVKLEIGGLSTQVDREVLENIKSPLNHLLRNAVDHGIEMPEQRQAAGKSPQAVIRINARHRSGMLHITVEDDGFGIDLDRLKSKIVNKGLSNEEMVSRMSEAELLDFLFLPSFSTRDKVTEVSGRGVGLDVVQDTVKEMRGTVSVVTRPGQGTRFQMQLPLTLSVVRTLLVDINGECYAFPLSRIDHLLKIQKSNLEILEDHQYITWNNQHIGLVVGAQIFDLPSTSNESEELSVIVISDKYSQYGIIVDNFIGERELAVQLLDSRLGKVRDISVAALLDDGTPALIVDVDDLVRSIDNLVSGGRLNKLHEGVTSGIGGKKRKRVLVVDDSITVREVERNMLEAYGYEVDVAVDGMDGWNAVRSSDYLLIITDVDMPRMDGIELVQMIKNEPHLKNLPVMIVSYKDREEDRRRGLEAGADYYLTKGSFHDESLREAVIDLIGEA